MTQVPPLSTPAPAPAPIADVAKTPAPAVLAPVPAPVVPDSAPLALPSPAPSPLPEPAAAGLAWVASMPPDSFLVSHGRFEGLAQAQRQIRLGEHLVNARIVPARAEGGRPAWMVVTGPFQSEQRARTYIGRLALKDVSLLQARDVPRP